MKRTLKEEGQEASTGGVLHATIHFSSQYQTNYRAFYIRGGESIEGESDPHPGRSNAGKKQTTKKKAGRTARFLVDQESQKSGRKEIVKGDNGEGVRASGSRTI